MKKNPEVRVFLSQVGQWSFAIVDGGLEVAGGGGFESEEEAMEQAEEVLTWLTPSA